jgi:hypothetical protein
MHHLAKCLTLKTYLNYLVNAPTVRHQCTEVELFCLSASAWWATCCPPHGFTVLAFCFLSPVRRLDQPQGSGGLGEHCSSPAVGRGVCAPPGRVAQPRLLATDRGYPAGAANRGRLLFGYFFLATQEKVTSCRATTGGFVFGYSCFDRLSTNGFKCWATPIQGERCQESGVARHGGHSPPYKNIRQKITSRSSPE